MSSAGKPGVRATCPVCRREFAVTASGALRHHRAVGPGPGNPACPGSGTPIPRRRLYTVTVNVVATGDVEARALVAEMDVVLAGRFESLIYAVPETLAGRLDAPWDDGSEPVPASVVARQES